MASELSPGLPWALRALVPPSDNPGLGFHLWTLAAAWPMASYFLASDKQGATAQALCEKETEDTSNSLSLLWTQRRCRRQGWIVTIICVIVIVIITGAF